MKKIIFVLSLFISYISIAQTKAIKISSIDNSTEITIKENKRIRIKTLDGKRISGKFKIINSETILIKNTTIKLNEIIMIKRNPLLYNIFVNSVIIYVGAIFVLVGVIATGLTNNVAGVALGTIIGGPIIFGGIKSPNILKGYKTTKSYNYKVVSLSN